MFSGGGLTLDRLAPIYSQVKQKTTFAHFYGKQGQIRVMYSSMAKLQEGLELAMKTSNFGIGPALDVEILQWHSNNHFYGDFLNEHHFEKEIKNAKKITEEGNMEEAKEEIDADKDKFQDDKSGTCAPEKKACKKGPGLIQIDKKLDLKIRKQKLQRSMDIWETRQHDEEVPDLILKPIAQPISEAKVQSTSPNQISNPVPQIKIQSEVKATSVPVIQFNLIPISEETSETKPLPKPEVKKSPKASKKSKITFFNSDEEKQQRDTFTENKDAFELYLDSQRKKAEDKSSFFRCRICRVTFESSLELGVHVTFDNAHKMTLQEKLECISYQKN